MPQHNTLPFQPKFKVMVAGSDVTDEIMGDISVTYELEKPIVCNLRFALDSVVTSVAFGVSVRVWAGYEREVVYSGPNIIDTANEFGLIFSGEVKQKGLDATPEGLVFITLTAYDMSYARSGFSKHIYRYPGKNSDAARQWADKPSLTTKDIVENIIGSMGKTASVDLGDIENKTWSSTAPLVQGDMSDMAFLMEVAKRSGCYAWTEYTPSDNPDSYQEVIHFKSKKSVVQKTDVTFVYLKRYVQSPAMYDFEGQDFKPNRLYLINASMEVDPLVLGIPLTQVTDFNLLTGKNEERFVTYEESENAIVYYKLDDKKVDDLMRTEEGRLKAERLKNFGAFSIPWAEAKEFFTREEIKSDIIDQIDAPVYGISLSATSMGSIAIRPFRSYEILGVPALHASLQRKRFSFFLRSMTHNISTQGFTTNLEFKA